MSTASESALNGAAMQIIELTIRRHMGESPELARASQAWVDKINRHGRADPAAELAEALVLLDKMGIISLLS